LDVNTVVLALDEEEADNGLMLRPSTQDLSPTISQQTSQEQTI